MNRLVSNQVQVARGPHFLAAHGGKSPAELTTWANSHWAEQPFPRSWIQCVAARLVIEGYTCLNAVPDDQFDLIVDLTAAERRHLPR